MALPKLRGITTTKSLKQIPIYIVPMTHRKEFLNAQSVRAQTIAVQQNWNEAGRILFFRDDKANIKHAAVLAPKDLSLYSLAHITEMITSILDESIVKHGFQLNGFKINDTDLHNVYMGWALSCYQYDQFKKSNKTTPLLYCPPKTLAAIKPQLESIYAVRDLINAPPNKMGPDELAKFAGKLAAIHKAKINIARGKELITQKFPMIYEVGKGSDRAPCLIDFTWGNPKHKKITIVGKGIVFDTGGYDIKPSASMLLMKKDMGGAAMALGLAHMIMAYKLPVRLRVLIPSAENSISGNAYRPSDIITSRNGTSVEIGNTDAEGRLVLADCLTAACEEKPDLLVDFATLTGAARSALGFDLPALFSNDNKLAQDIQATSMTCGDPMWHMPLWSPYKKDILSPIADINNAGSNPAGAVTAALFLDHFVSKDTKWVHIDHYAWEQSGRAGRTRGGSDMGMRTMFEFIKNLK